MSAATATVTALPVIDQAALGGAQLPSVPRNFEVHAAAPQSAMDRALEVAFRSGASLEQLQQLLDMKERLDNLEAKRAFVRAMAEFKLNPPKIVKDKLVSFRDRDGNVTQYMHATLAAVCDAAIAGLAKVGVSHRWDIDQSQGIKVICVLTHRDGHSEATPMSAPADTSGKKNAIQSIASSVTYLQRYTLLAATGLATEEQDDDGDGHADPIADPMKPHLDAINAGQDVDSVFRAFTEASKVVLRSKDKKALDIIRAARTRRCEELGITTAQWAAARAATAQGEAA